MSEEMALLREEIDRIDSEVQRLFEERMAVSERIGKYKAEHGLPVLDRQRELQKIAGLKASASDEKNAEGIARLYETIFEISRSLQENEPRKAGGDLL